MPSSRAGRHHEPFTVDDLARALRGIPRTAEFFVRMPDGSERPMLAITGMTVRDTMQTGGERGAPYRIVLAVGDSDDTDKDTSV